MGQCGSNQRLMIIPLWSIILNTISYTTTTTTTTTTTVTTSSYYNSSYIQHVICWSLKSVLKWIYYFVYSCTSNDLFCYPAGAHVALLLQNEVIPRKMVHVNLRSKVVRVGTKILDMWSIYHYFKLNCLSDM